MVIVIPSIYFQYINGFICLYIYIFFIVKFPGISSTQHNAVTSLPASGLSVGGFYQTQTPHHSPKYPENGHDTLSDFVTFVCQEAENTQQGQQVTT